MNFVCQRGRDSDRPAFSATAFDELDPSRQRRAIASLIAGQRCLEDNSQEPDGKCVSRLFLITIPSLSLDFSSPDVTPRVAGCLVTRGLRVDIDSTFENGMKYLFTHSLRILPTTPSTSANRILLEHP